MERFVKSAGKNCLNPQLGKKKEIQPEQAKKVAILKTQDINTLKPQERMKIMKEIKYQ